MTFRRCPVLFSLICLTLSCLLLFSGCSSFNGGTKPAEASPSGADDTPLSMYVGLGNGAGNYYANLHQAILDATGIDVQYVYNSVLDTTTCVNDMLAAGDPPADIIITAAYSPADSQKTGLLDLATCTSLTNLFTASRLQSLSQDGRIYQLPFTTRLIGFEYNKTLFTELGLSAPKNLEDLLALKAYADENGLPFAYSGGFATGHGFNYLFHLMGADYLSTPAGTTWFEQFMSGKTGIEPFVQEASYFKEYVENGLFGTLYTEGWNSYLPFTQQRALFYYNITNDVYSYDGFQYNSDGTITGASYNEDGSVVTEDNPDGNAVIKEGKVVFYKESDESLQGLPRCDVPGAVILHDTYASIPWISEFGASNCFTSYDNMVIGLRKELGEPENSQKLAQAVQVLEFLTTPAATNLFLDIYNDGYVSVKTFETRPSLLYIDSYDSVSKGYLMPWYYNSFDNSTIMAVGELVNRYIENPTEAGFQAIFKTLDQSNQNRLNTVKEIATVVDETLDIPDNATMQCISNALIMQSALDSAGSDATVNVSLVPYTNSIKNLPFKPNLSVVQSKLYEGELEKSHIRTLVAGSSNTLCAIRMTGAEIKELAAVGYHPLEDYDVDQVFPYRMLVKAGTTLSDKEEYTVVIPSESLVKSTMERFSTEGRIFVNEAGTITTNCEDGLALFFEAHPQLSRNDLVWD